MITVILVGERNSIKSNRLDRGVKHYVDKYTRAKSKPPFNYLFMDYKRDGSGRIDTSQIPKEAIPSFFIQEEENQTLLSVRNEDILVDIINQHKDGKVNLFENATT